MTFKEYLEEMKHKNSDCKPDCECEDCKDKVETEKE